MANVVMNKFKQQSMIGNVVLTDGNVNVALINNIFGVSSIDQISDISTFSSISTIWESSGTGYTVGGITLSGVGTSQDDVNNKAIFSASNVTWTIATISTYGAAIYRSTDSLMICMVDFGGVKTSTAGDFQIQWDSAGILNLT